MSKEEGSDDESEEDEDDEDNDCVAETLEDLKTYTQCLVDLGPSLEWPARDAVSDERNTLVTALEDRPAHQYFSDIISTKFPLADSELVDRLGKANFERYIRLIRSATEEAQPSEVVEEGGARSIKTTSAFQDSGLGSSVPTEATSALSMFSVEASKVGGRHARLPPMPEAATRGLPFTCNACRRTISVSNTHDWMYVSFHPISPILR